MRLFGIISTGLLTAACGLSMNPDLPSARNSDNETATGDGDGDIGLIEDGDGILDGSGMGGSGGCHAPGGAGGAPQECEATP